MNVPRALPSEEHIRRALDGFCHFWNQGDLESACSIYADDASFISKDTYINGKAKIIERYRNAYPDRAAMGTLSLKILELRRCVRGYAAVNMVTVVVQWTVKHADGSESSGYALETYEICAGKITLIQDATM